MLIILTATTPKSPQLTTSSQREIIEIFQETSDKSYQITQSQRLTSLYKQDTVASFIQTISSLQ